MILWWYYSDYGEKENIHDGRASNSVKKLMLSLKREEVKIYLVDQEAKSGNERDKLMARNLSKLNGRVAFLCGNVHARKKPLQLEKKDEMYKQYPNGKVKTCGYFLNKNKKVISIKVMAINRGKFYNYSIQDYQKNSFLLKKYESFFLPKIVKSSDNLFDYFYLIDKFSYSK